MTWYAEYRVWVHLPYPENDREDGDYEEKELKGHLKPIEAALDTVPGLIDWDFYGVASG